LATSACLRQVGHAIADSTNSRALTRLFAGALLVMATVAGLEGTWARAESTLMPAAPAGRNESGAPSFVILGDEALGLDTEPTDLHLMPDGRLLVVTPQRLVFGDGTRWETVSEIGTGLALPGCAVDQGGQIYFGAPGGFGCAHFDEDGRWHMEFAARWPADERPDRNVPLRAVEVGSEWFWHSDSGSIISWRPGQAARIVGRVESVSQIFQFRGIPYASDASNGRLLRLTGGSGEEVFAPGTMSLKDAITSALPWNDHQLLVGSVGRGVQLFDGKTLTPLRTGGVLASGATINDLCVTAGGLFAAAVENFGVICFDRNGRTVQTLDRTLDHRLAHVKRLLSSPGGTIFGLVDQGLLEIEFPSRITNLEPLVGVGVTIPAVRRFNGDLWVYSAERVLRGVYDEEGRLARLEVDTPGNSDVSSFSVVGDRLVAGTDHGGFCRTPAGWVSFAPTAKDLRVVSAAPIHDRWLYAAQGEIGWLRATDTGFQVERIPAPALERVHSSYVDRPGRIWLELGTGRVGRIELRDDGPALTIFTGNDGLPNSWVAPFEVDGVVKFNATNQWLRFDESTQRFGPDIEFAELLAGLENPAGRPARDGLGRLWVDTASEPQLLDNRGGGPPRNLHERFPAGLRPWTYFPETGGVVWMVSYHRLVRYDPAIPEEPAPPLRALITRVTLPVSNRTLASAAELPPLDFSDNSIAVHFAAPGHSFASPITFEVMLEGAGAGWSPVGSSGSVIFNRLKEGRYVLHLLPRAGETRGEEATLAFTVRPPWYRSPLARGSYVALALGLFSLAVWLFLFLQQRESARLETLVAERTASLRASEASVQASYELLHSVIEGTTDAIFVKDLAGRYQTINSATEIFFGKTAAEIIGHTDAELFPADSARAIAAFDKQVLASGKAETREEFLTGGGQTRACLTVKAPRRGANGRIIGLIGVSRDITARKQADEALSKSEARLLLEFELMPTGCIVWGPDRRVEKWNPAAEHIFGYPAAEAVGRRAEELIEAPDSHGSRAPFWSPNAAENFHSHRASQNVTKSGKMIWCEWTNAPLRDNSGAVLGIMSMVEDVTGRKALEDQLRQAQKMEVIGQLAGGVAHDFNNILTAMTLIVAELSDAPSPAGPQLEELRSLTNRAARLTQQLLVFARRQVMQFTTLDLSIVVSEVMKMLGRLIGEQVTIRLEWNAHALWVEADAGMLDQMVMNLCLNARDAMPGGGTLTVATSVAEFTGNDVLRNPEARPGRFACLRISDSGVGMGPDILAHVFEPFFTTKDVGMGTGLGLASVYGIVHQHQGWIEVESAIGRGTTFRVYLPTSKEPAGKAGRAPKGAPGKRGTETILLVEDEEPVRKLARTMLERLGYKVLAATDGPGAMQLWAEHGGQVDLLFTDMVMPNGMTGIQLGQLFQQSKPQLKIVVMSGYSEDMIGTSSQSGARVSFLAKPFQAEVLAETIRQCLDGKAFG
jgi:two-component system, cell cycle sensor histidine kinase and response regulator CckA